MSATSASAEHSEPPVLIERSEGWRTITLNRPARMNAMDLPALQMVVAALEDAEADPSCRAMVITGAGRGFCAGADLIGDGITTRRAGESLDQGWNRLARKLHTLAMPVVCAVNGVAAGAGANIALGCDFVLAARSARFIQIFSKIGLVPDAGGSFLMPRLVGPARARALAMLAEPVVAEQAEAWGMIWRAVDDDRLVAESQALAARLATLPTQALLLTREAMAASATNSFDAQLDLERDLQRKAAQTPDHAEGVAAFREKRAPHFTGRRG